MKILLLSLLLSLSTTLYSQESTQELKPFATDYCSKWPEGTSDNKNLWADCCFTHDLHYWIGGTEDERKDADKELKSCVKLSGASIASFLMYMGVRMGGKPGDADYAWGFGWKTSRGYEKIPPEDVMAAKTLLESSEYNNEEWMKNLINEFINTTLSSRMQQ